MEQSDPTREIQELGALLLNLSGDPEHWSSDARRASGASSAALDSAIEWLSLAGPPTNMAEAERLALLLLLTKDSAVMRFLRDVARDTYRHYERMLSPYIDEADMLSTLRWRVWERPPVLASPWSFRTYVRLVARASTVDLLRSIGRHSHHVADDDALDGHIDSAVLADERLDIERLFVELRDIAASVPDGEILLAVLANVIDQHEALLEINQRRGDRGASPWTPEGLRTALHRLRKLMRSKVSTDAR